MTKKEEWQFPDNTCLDQVPMVEQNHNIFIFYREWEARFIFAVLQMIDNSLRGIRTMKND